MYHKNGHAIVHRIQRHEAPHQLDEFHLKPGEGLLFFKHKKPVRADKFSVFEFAKEAKKENMLEIFAVNIEHIGLMLASGFHHDDATTAFIGKDGYNKKLATMVRNDGKILYRGFLDKTLEEVEKFVKMWKQ